MIKLIIEKAVVDKDELIDLLAEISNKLADGYLADTGWRIENETTNQNN